jgi:hypothetical protein
MGQTSNKQIKLKCGKYAVPISSVQQQLFSERYEDLIDTLFLDGFLSDSHSMEKIMDGLKQFLIANSSESIKQLNEFYYLVYLQRNSVPDFGLITDAAFMVIRCLIVLNQGNIKTFMVDGNLAINYYGQLIFVETEILNFFLNRDIKQPLIANLDAYRIEALAKYGGIVSDVAFNYNHIKWQ